MKLAKKVLCTKLITRNMIDLKTRYDEKTMGSP